MSGAIHPNQVKIDKALAASLLYDRPELTIDDAVIAQHFQQQEEGKVVRNH